MELLHTDSLLCVGFVLVVPFLVLGCGSNGSGGHSHDGHSHSHGDGMGASGEPRVIEANGPTLSLDVSEDPSGGYRVKLNTRYFKIVNTGQAQEPAGDTVAGHAHLYVDREMVAMFYEDEYQLPLMEPGRHVISVMLSDMSHRPFLVDGKIVRDTAVVQVPEPTDGN